MLSHSVVTLTLCQMLTKDSRKFTGNFCIDEEVLRGEGVTDFEKYRCIRGTYEWPKQIMLKFIFGLKQRSKMLQLSTSRD